MHSEVWQAGILDYGTPAFFLADMRVEMLIPALLQGGLPSG